MSQQKDEPKYPWFYYEDSETGQFFMSKRFYAACKAMEGLLSSLQGMAVSEMNKELVERSYKIADEMLKQENEPL